MESQTLDCLREQNQQLQDMQKNLADFIALFEASENKLLAKQQQLDESRQDLHTEIHNQLATVQKSMSDLNEVLSAAGAARWRLAAETAMKQGDAHLQAIQASCQRFEKLIHDAEARINHLTNHFDNKCSRALQFITDDNVSITETFKQQTDSVYKQVSQTAGKATGQIKKLTGWLRWERLSIALVAGLSAALLTTIYVNAEMPWESHHRSVHERVIGKKVLQAWPMLSEAKRKELLAILGNTI